MLIEILNHIKNHPLHYNGEFYEFNFEPYETLIINNIKTPKGNNRKSNAEDGMIKFGTQSLDTYNFVNATFETIDLELTSYKSAKPKNANN